MSAQHTAGEWSRHIDEDGNAVAVRQYVTGANGGTVAKDICRMPIPQDGRIHPNQRTTWAEINANSLLIAAAPDLFYALKNCIQRLERPELSPDANVVLEQAHAAIAKATGSDPLPQGGAIAGATEPKDPTLIIEPDPNNSKQYRFILKRDGEVLTEKGGFKSYADAERAGSMASVYEGPKP